MPFWGWIIIAVVLLLIAAVLFISYQFAKMVLRPNTHDNEFLLNEAYEFKRFTPEYIASLNTEDIIIPSKYGYDMHGLILRSEKSELEENRNRIAVLCHGYTSSKIVMSGYAGILLKMGFTCIMYDHRNHGDNAKNVNTTMGYYEREDLKTVIDWIYERFGPDVRIITYGESMGSAIVLSHLEIDDRPVLTIADCGYSDLVDLFKYLLKGVYHMPVWPILPIAEIMLKIGGHFDPKDVSPRRGVIKTKIPILFCHGDQDTFVPTFMSVEMSKLGEGVRELYLCPGAIHAQSYSIDPVKYSEVVTSFITKYYK
ncbi:MAG: alpha/beta fold hydrolase [Lachnospiraceae bacterium]|nr:alpha/beta fold hydrolase [Lachnospiraceae bacterium]